MQKYPRKFVWSPVLLEEQARKIADKIKKEQGVHIETTDVLYKLGHDLKEGRIKPFMFDLGFQNVKPKKKK